LFTGPNGKSQSEKRLGKQKRKSKLKKQIQNNHAMKFEQAIKCSQSNVQKKEKLYTI
jgi:hypothetical protein